MPFKHELIMLNSRIYSESIYSLHFIPTATTLIHTIILPCPLYLSNNFLALISFPSSSLVTTQQQRQLDIATRMITSGKKVRVKFYPFAAFLKAQPRVRFCPSLSSP